MEKAKSDKKIMKKARKRSEKIENEKQRKDREMGKQ